MSREISDPFADIKPFGVVFRTILIVNVCVAEKKNNSNNNYINDNLLICDEIATHCNKEINEDNIKVTKHE